MVAYDAAVPEALQDGDLTHGRLLISLGARSQVNLLDAQGARIGEPPVADKVHTAGCAESDSASDFVVLHSASSFRSV